MVQNKEEEIKFFDKFVKNKNGYRPLSKISYEKLFFELERNLNIDKKNAKIVWKILKNIKFY